MDPQIDHQTCCKISHFGYWWIWHIKHLHYLLPLPLMYTCCIRIVWYVFIWTIYKFKWEWTDRDSHKIPIQKVQQNLCFLFEMDLTYSTEYSCHHTVCVCVSTPEWGLIIYHNKMNTGMPTISITFIAWAIKVYFVMVFFPSFLRTDVGISHKRRREMGVNEKERNQRRQFS